MSIDKERTRNEISLIFGRAKIEEFYYWENIGEIIFEVQPSEPVTTDMLVLLEAAFNGKVKFELLLEDQYGDWPTAALEFTITLNKEEE